MTANQDIKQFFAGNLEGNHAGSSEKNLQEVLQGFLQEVLLQEVY